MVFLAFFWSTLSTVPVAAQIGGKTAADGVFILEDTEDLDLVAAGVGRNWVADVDPAGGLSALVLTGSGLTLAPDQTPVGALRAVGSPKAGFLNFSFGVPMPAVVGASTLTDPGNVAGFAALRFLARYDSPAPDVRFQVILETYPGIPCTPGGTEICYPKLYYQFSPPRGSAFQWVTIDLWAPDIADGPETLTLADRLSQTRYLSFYSFADVHSSPGATLTLDVDDFQLEPATGASAWEVYP